VLPGGADREADGASVREKVASEAGAHTRQHQRSTCAPSGHIHGLSCVVWGTKTAQVATVVALSKEAASY
jgi:hypothetical protein